jgi:hypothetical protein
MPKRGIDAASRFFFDELPSLDAARLTATGAIRLGDRHGVIAFGDEDHGVKRRKCISVVHKQFPNGGWWTICPRCGDGGGLKPRASQRGRNNCLTLEMENGAPANYLANRNAPTLVCRGRGGMASDLTA